MLAVKYVVKLFDMPPDYGIITAFDSYGNTIFIGTHRGVVHRFLVERAPPSGAAGTGPPRPEACARRSSCGAAGDDEANAEAFNIFTTHVRSEVISAQRARVTRIQHSRTHALLFVLCGKKLAVLDSSTLTPIQTITDNVGTFFVSSASQASGKRQGLHNVCAAEKNGKGVCVFELDATQGKSVRAILAQELVLPEPVQTMVTYGGIVCVGLRREYSLLSLADGNARGILALGGSKTPLLAPGDGEAYMRYQNSIFTVSMRSMPATGRALGRTIQLEDEVACMVVRHPFLFAFNDHHCDVFSLYDDEVVERLPIPGCIFGSQLGRGDFLYVAGRTKIWMICIHPLRHQLADLVERFKIEEAFHLLGNQRAKVSVDLQGIELELHIMAGFAYLYHCRPKEALQHFNDHVDPREVLIHVPELIPPHQANYSRRLRHLLRRRASCVKQECGCGGPSRRPDSPSQISNATGVEEVDRDGAAAVESADGGYWGAWEGCSPHNTHHEDIEGAWLKIFHSYPLVSTGPPLNDKPKREMGGPLSDLSSPKGRGRLRAGQLVPHVDVRQVNDIGCVDAETFLAHCWTSLKDELLFYLRSRLSLAPEAHARAMEYALLVLYLQSRDYRGAYRMVRYGRSLQLEDCYDLLYNALEFRLLALLLHRQGFQDEAAALLRSRVHVSSFVKPRKWRTLGSLWGDSVAEVSPQLVPGDSSSTAVRGGAAVEGICSGDAWFEQLTETQRHMIYRLLASDVALPFPFSEGAAPGLHGGGGGDMQEAASWPTGAVLPPTVGPNVPLMLEELGLPGNSFSEVFFAMDQLNVAMLHEILRETPESVLVRDDEGCTLMHLAAGLAMVGTGAAEAAAERNSLCADDTKRSVVMQLVISCLLMLLDYGCPLSWREVHQRTWIDVLRYAVDDVHFDMVIATMLGACEICGKGAEVFQQARLGLLDAAEPLGEKGSARRT